MQGVVGIMNRTNRWQMQLISFTTAYGSPVVSLLTRDKN